MKDLWSFSVQAASINWASLCLSAAEEDAGDAEQDAAADAWKRPMRAELASQRHLLCPLCTTVRPSETNLDIVLVATLAVHLSSVWCFV